MSIPHIELPDEELASLGDTYITEIRALDSGRTELIDKYQRFVENYEGDVGPEESEKPWIGASDAHIPITATDSDITIARIQNAQFGQTPTFIIKPLAGHWVEFSRNTQKFSEYLETQEMNLFDLFREVNTITVKFGSAVVYLPWENRPIKVHTTDENGDLVEEEIDEMDKPGPRVIHPKDFLLPLHSSDLQKAPSSAYYYKLRPATLRLWKDRGFFREDPAEFLEAQFGNASEDTLEIPQGDVHEDKVQETRERNTGILRTKVPDELDMVHIFARMDIDGDGLEECVNFHMHVKTGVIPRLVFDHYRHRRRPFVDFHFFPRDGIWYSIGIPEMLLNIQQNVDVTFRQVQDNNTVANTQGFIAKEGGSITPDESFHPAKVWFPREMDEFIPIQLGRPQFNTSMNDVQFVMTWGERRTSVSDPVATPGERQPATSFLASLQEQARRLDFVIAGIRNQMGEFWMQVLELYAQFKPIVEFEVQEEGEEGAKFETVRWEAMGEEDFRRRIHIKPTASTASLNKAVARQELASLLEQQLAFNQSTANLLNLYLQAQDPTLKTFLEKVLKGQHLIMQRIYDTHELVKDQDNIIPDPEEYLNAISPLQPPIVPPQSGSGTVGGAQELAPGGGGGFAPATAPNRPAGGTGLPRVPGVPGGPASGSSGPQR